MNRHLDELNKNINKNKLIENDLIYKIEKYEHLLSYFNNCESKKIKLKKDRNKALLNIYINFAILTFSIPIFITLPILGFIPTLVSILCILNNCFICLDRTRRMSERFNKKNIKIINSELIKYKKRLNTIVGLNNEMLIEKSKISKSKIHQFQSESNIKKTENSNIKVDDNTHIKIRIKDSKFK